MRDSVLDPRWLAEQMRLNPARKLDNGLMFSGPVRLTFTNIFKPKEPNKRRSNGDNDGSVGKYGCAILWPLGADLRAFEKEWYEAARLAFPKNWDANGRSVGLHSPFHDQIEKTVGLEPYRGYTPGAIYLNTTSNRRPQVVDINMNPIIDESRVYPGVWAYVSLNTYDYSNNKMGIGFGLQSIMLIADDTVLGGGSSDPRKDFAGVTITAQSNIADKFNTAPVQGAAASASIMPSGGFVGHPGGLPVQPLPMTVDDLM